MASEFFWDEAKAAGNFQKHGVSFEEAKTVFYDPFYKTLVDELHSIGEERLILLGQSEHQRLLVVAYVERSDDHIRLISARLADRRERDWYEEGE
jgi:uncharacterized DUF497 family protein